MSPPSSPALQQLHRLDKSSSDFQDQLWNVLHGKEYIQCERNLQGEDLVWLVDYLDKVRRPRRSSPTLRSGQRRFLAVSILPAQFPASVYANSEAYAAPRRYSPRHTLFRLTFCKLIASRLHLEVPVTCTREPSVLQRFASNVSAT